MCWATSVLDRHDLVPDLCEVTREEGATVNHHVDLICTRSNGVLRLSDFEIEPGASAWECGGNGGNLHGTSRERLLRDSDHVGVAAERRDGWDLRVAGLRAHRLGGELPDLPRSVPPLQRGEVAHADRKPQRPDLGRLLDRASLQHRHALFDPNAINRGDITEPSGQRARICCGGE